MATQNVSEDFWQGEKVRLRPMSKDDAGLWLDEDGDSETIRFLSYGIELPKSLKAAEEFFDRYSEFNNSSERIMFSIETVSGELVGGINIHSMDKKNGTFSTGTRIYRSFRRRGYLEEAKRIVLRYAFTELRFQKYNLRCIETNEAIIEHAKKIGCREEGRIRRNIYTNGRYYDECVFGLTIEEFNETDSRRIETTTARH